MKQIFFPCTDAMNFIIGKENQMDKMSICILSGTFLSYLKRVLYDHLTE